MEEGEGEGKDGGAGEASRWGCGFGRHLFVSGSDWGDGAWALGDAFGGTCTTPMRVVLFV